MNRLLILCEKNKPKCSGNSVVSATLMDEMRGHLPQHPFSSPVKLYCF